MATQLVADGQERPVTSAPAGRATWAGRLRHDPPNGPTGPEVGKSSTVAEAE